MQNAIVIENSGVDESVVKDVMVQFAEFETIAAEYEDKAMAIVVTDESQTDLMAQARTGRLFLKQTRVALGKTKDRLKRRSIDEGKAIQAIYNSLKDLIEPLEDHLDKQENFIEIRESARKDNLQMERASILEPLGVDVTLYDLREMPEESFNELVRSRKESVRLKKEEDDRLEKERLEKEEADRIERERVEKENKKLRLEAAEREKELAAEREKQAEENRKKEAELEKERKAKREAELKAEFEKKEKDKALRREQTAKAAKAKAVEDKKLAETTADEKVLIARRAITHINQSSVHSCESCMEIRSYTEDVIKKLGGWLERENSRDTK